MNTSMICAIFGIDTWFYKLLYSMMQGILKLCDTVYEVVLTLCGMKKNTASGDGLLETLAKDNTIKMVFKWLIILGVCVLGVVICIAVIRSVLSRKLDDPIKAQKGIATRTISSIITMVLIPVFFFTFITFVGDITQYIINSMNVSTSTGQVMNSATDWSVAQEVFETATGQNCSYKLSADSFADQYPIDPNSVNYIIGIFGGAIVLVAMFMMGFKLAERIFMLIFYYIISPLILAVSPLDDGNRFAVWRDSVIAKLLASGGIIVCISLFLVCMPVIKNFSTSVFGHSFTAQVFNLLFIIAGSFFASRGGEIIANLVGDNIGANEGRETADSLRKAMAGVKIGGGVVGAGILTATKIGSGTIRTGSKVAFGTKESRSIGASNEAFNNMNEDGSYGQKARKGSGVVGLADSLKNIRRYGVIGGSFQNYKNSVINNGQSSYRKSVSSQKKEDDPNGKASKN